MTVSRVLNGHASVTEVTRDRVQQAMEELRYQPNTAARTLASGRSGTIGVVSVETPQHGPASTLFGIEAAARERGLFVTFAVVRDRRTESLREAMDHLRAIDVDGIVLVAPLLSMAGAAADLDRAGVPTVVLAGSSAPSSAAVAIDQAHGARLAVEHLLALGHATVHHVAGPGDWADARARRTAWRSTLRRHGREVPPVVTGDWSAASGHRAGRTLAADQDVTAVFVANDQMALGVLRALQEAGRSVPGEVSVVGFDDIAEAAYFLPPLTTVRQDFDELGRRCVEQLTGLIDGGDPAPVAVLPELVVRASCGGARP